MLAVATYPREYVDTCRSRMEPQLAAYERLASYARYGQGRVEAGLA